MEELLSQRKVAAWVAQEEDTQRESEVSSLVSQSGILGYGKGKAPEKRVCTHCLRRGIECEWDEGA